MKLISDLPPFYRPHVPHSNRRAAFHNYKAPGYYMITVSKCKEAPLFSTVIGEKKGGGVEVYTQLTSAGEIIASQILDLNGDSRFEIRNFVIMPDHVHILWRVREWLEKDFGYHVGRFKSRCTKTWREELAEDSEMRRVSLFAEKFNDRIAFDGEMVRRFSNYIGDNPRRRWLAMSMPYLFQRAERVRILDREMDVFGNFQLLQHPLIVAGVVSSRYSPEKRREYERRWEETIRGGGVIVSPFISPAEKNLMHRAIAEGGKIIRIVADGMGPRYKPSGREFDLCAEGRCLHLGMPRLSAHKDELRRDRCLALNEMAYWIESHPAETMHLINGERYMR